MSYSTINRDFMLFLKTKPKNNQMRKKKNSPSSQDLVLDSI